MGLDNGLTIRAKTTRGMEYLKKNQVFEKEFGSATLYELCYFRKCWNIRSVILRTFRNKDYDGEGGSFYLTSLGDLIDFLSALEFFLDEKVWDATSNGSIWTWYEALPGIARGIHDIHYLIEDIENDDISIDDFEIEFYDSY